MPVPQDLRRLLEPSSASSTSSTTSAGDLDRSTFYALAGLAAGLTLLLRTWALAGSWFYADDHRLLGQAQDSEFGVRYLTEPFDSQFMPFGRAVAWLVTHDAGGGAVHASWSSAVIVSVVLSAAAAAACLWMLTAAFGRRWEVLVLYVLALTATTALPAGMWWAASLNQLPLLVAWPAAVAATLRYLQTGRTRWVLAIAAVLALGLLAYVKTVLVVPVLAYLVLAYFSTGSLPDRIRSVVQGHKVAVITVTTLVGGFTAYYVSSVPSVVTQSSVADTAGPLADRLIGTSWATAVMGGPWRWNDANAPVSITDPPDWAAHAAWVVLALLVAYVSLRRTGTWRAWGLITLGLSLDYALLLLTRGPVFGAIAGNEMRYLTESSLYVPLGLGLALLPLRSALTPSRPRETPLVLVRLGPAVSVLAASAVVGGSLVSTAVYVGTWHDDNPGRSYLDAVTQATQGRERTDVVDTVVPPEVMSPVQAPWNSTSRLLPVHVSGVDFPAVSGDLQVLSPNGVPSPARIDPATTSVPGRVEGCGWRITSDRRTIPLQQETLEYDWWLRIGYLSSQRSALTVTAGDVSRSTVVNPGLGSLFVHTPGSFDSVTLSDLEPDTTLCVDVIEVGVPTSGEAP